MPPSEVAGVTRAKSHGVGIQKYTVTPDHTAPPARPEDRRPEPTDSACADRPQTPVVQRPSRQEQAVYTAARLDRVSPAIYPSSAAIVYRSPVRIGLRGHRRDCAPT